MKIKNSFSVKLFLLILLISLPISLLLFVGKVDPDFFSYYYIGRGVNLGMDMFKDFADNKGPVNYFFYTAIYWIYGNNYRLALFSANLFFDSLGIYYLWKLINIRLSFSEVLNKEKILLLIFAIAFYKSFSITYFMSAIYPETIAICFIIISLYCLETKKFSLSGIFFALAVLCRQTEAFFIIFYIYLFAKQQNRRSFIFWIISGVFCTCLVLLFCFLIGGNLVALVDNMVLFNLSYFEMVTHNYWKILFTFSLVEFRIVLSLIFVIFVLGYLFIKTRSSQKGWLTFFVLGAFLSTFLQANFYSHHYFQFAPVFIVLFFWLFKNRKILSWIWGSVIIVALIVNYWFYSFSNAGSLDNNASKNTLAELNVKKYVQVVPFYPEVYFYLERDSPDRYYHYFFLSDYFIKGAERYRQEHNQIPKEILKRTTFLFINGGKNDWLAVEEYKKNFSESFKLIKTENLNINGYQIEIYESKI